jgi:hypothetical protein
VFGRRGNGDFCDAQTHVRPRAAGVSPPWFGHTIAVSGEANAVQRRANTRPGAAFVSPPWLGKRICQCASAKSRKTAIDALTNVGAVAVVNPRGADAPRSWLHGVRSPRKWRFLRYANARSTRSGGREPAVVRSYDRCVGRSECCSATSEYTTRSGVCQPAVVGETHLPVRFRKVAGDRHRCAHERRCSRGSEPTGADAPRFWLHGVRSPMKWRFLRCTNARSQERRSSARRGSVMRTLSRDDRTLFSGDRIHNKERRVLARRGFDDVGG